MWFWWGVATAIISAISIIINKKALSSVSTSLTTWSLFALSLPFIVVCYLLSAKPTLTQDFYLGIIGSSLFFAISKTVSLLVIKQTELSKVIPLNTFTSVFIYLLALIFLGEVIRTIPLIGLSVVIVGAYVLNAGQRSQGVLKPFIYLATHKESRLYLIAVLLSAASGTFDKVALKGSLPASPLAVLLGENLLISMFLLGYLNIKKAGWIKELKNNYKILTLASGVYALGSITTFAGFADGPIALVSGVKRLQLLVVLLFSFIFFKDKPTKYSVIASIITILGIFLIKTAQ
jgi:drug/metabolite transporter (DMT)-like permease